uniref:Glycosyltransferase n=1 Tax=Picea sitchensis TaxID=3332 RepID=A9NXT2_PICSI|nr:unknown [Picea sitchensis]
MDARKPHVAIFPSVGMGHLIPFFEFAKLLASGHGFSITFITAKFMVTPSQTAYTKSLASSGLSIRFIELPEVELDSEEKKAHPLVLIFKVLEKTTGSVENALRTLLSDSSNPISAFITDIFCTATLEVSKKLQIPSYVLYTGSASNLFLILYHRTMDAEMTESLKDLDGPVKVPGLPSIPARDFPDPMQDKSGPFYHLFLRLSHELLKADGILINTFQDLESGSVQALLSGEIDGTRIPSIYPVGPLISSPESDHHDGSGSLQWLDKQPAASVLFVSFGSVNFLSADQIAELALGLEGSGQRFLWVLPSPPNNASNPDVSALLPPGFEQRTKDRGLVVTSWAPQVAILAHPSTGGFVSHCGWNSVLESVSHGVTIIAWPLQAEQRTTAFFLVNDIKMAVRTKMGADGIVTKEEVEKAAKELMEGEDGKKKRERARELRESAKAALAEGGSSRQALAAAAALFCK